MIVGMGIDLVELDRIRAIFEKFGTRFLDKILTDTEKRPLERRVDPVPYLAAMFAAKEAAVKALGTGFRQGVHLHNVEVRHLPTGKPELYFLGKARERFEALGAARAHVSLTHERSMAAAVAVIET